MRKYFDDNCFVQIEKLFKNALVYLNEKRVNKLDKDTFLVIGNSKKHKVSSSKCDCDLFNGVGVYTGNAGECSHVQAVKLFGA